MRILLREFFQFKWLICVVIGMAFGYIVGSHHSASALAQCREQNAVLTNDLTGAVKRGVILETNLILCKENKNASH